MEVTLKPDLQKLSCRSTLLMVNYRPQKFRGILAPTQYASVTRLSPAFRSLEPRLSVPDCVLQLWRKIGGKAWTDFSRDTVAPSSQQGLAHGWYVTVWWACPCREVAAIVGVARVESWSVPAQATRLFVCVKGMSPFSATVGYYGCLGSCSRTREDKDGSSNCELRSCTQ